jgi:hypothetical protein
LAGNIDSLSSACSFTGGFTARARANFSTNIQLFQTEIPILDQGFIGKINKLRESGNNSAHVLELDLLRLHLDDSKDDIEFVLKTLIRLNSITTLQ